MPVAVVEFVAPVERELECTAEAAKTPAIDHSRARQAFGRIGAEAAILQLL